MTQGRRKWTAEQKAAASLAGKERFAKKWMQFNGEALKQQAESKSENEILEAVQAVNDVTTMKIDYPKMPELPKPEFVYGTSEAPHGVVVVIGTPLTVTEATVVLEKSAVALIDNLTEEPIRDQVRVGSREVVLRVRTDGQMVSMQGPCLCGAVKREWHQICLKQQS